jgi:hypothetical protein
MTVLTVTVVVAVWAAVAPSNAGPQTNAKARLMPLLKTGYAGSDTRHRPA